MRHKDDITEADVLTAIEGVLLVDAEYEGDGTFNQDEIAFVLADVHPTDLDAATKSVRNHFKRFLWKGYIVRFGNDRPHARGRPCALYRRTEKGERVTGLWTDKLESRQAQRSQREIGADV